MRNDRVRTYSCIFSDYFSRGDCLFLEESRQGEHVLSNFFLRRLVSLHQGVEVVPPGASPVSHIFVVVAPVSLTDVSSTGRLHNTQGWSQKLLNYMSKVGVWLLKQN